MCFVVVERRSYDFELFCQEDSRLVTFNFKGPGSSVLRANGIWYHPSFLSVNSFISVVYSPYGAIEDRLGY